MSPWVEQRVVWSVGARIVSVGGAACCLRGWSSVQRRHRAGGASSVQRKLALSVAGCVDAVHRVCCWSCIVYASFASFRAWPCLMCASYASFASFRAWPCLLCIFCVLSCVAVPHVCILLCASFRALPYFCILLCVTFLEPWCIRCTCSLTCIF